MAYSQNAIPSIIVSLILGAIIGVGGGYLAIYPRMLETRTEEIEDEISNLNNLVSVIPEINERLYNLELNITELPQLNSRISTLESSMVILDEIRSDVQEVKNDIQELNEFTSFINSRHVSSYDYLLSLIEILQESQNSDESNQSSPDLLEIMNRLDSIETTLSYQGSSINNLLTRIDESEAHRLLKKTLAKPGQYIADQIIDIIFEELKSSENLIIQWISLKGETYVKSVISAVINSQIPTLVWNDYFIEQVSTNTYLTSAITYFPLYFPTGLPIIGDIKIAQVGLVMRGIVDISTDSVSSLEIVTLTT